jgi:hypothetical protein
MLSLYTIFVVLKSAIQTLCEDFEDGAEKEVARCFSANTPNDDTVSQGRGYSRGIHFENVRRKFSDLTYKSLRLFWDSARKRRPLRGSLETSAINPPFAKGG